FGPSRYRGKLGGINHRHLRQSSANLFALERLVVYKGERIDADVQCLGDIRNGLAFWFPTDLRMKEIFRETAHLQELQGVVAIVLAGDRMEDSPAVGFLDDINDALFEAKFLDAIFDQHAIPERVIEIPHDAFPWFCFAVCRRAVAGR